MASFAGFETALEKVHHDFMQGYLTFLQHLEMTEPFLKDAHTAIFHRKNETCNYEPLKGIAHFRVVYDNCKTFLPVIIRIEVAGKSRLDAPSSLLNRQYLLL